MRSLWLLVLAAALAAFAGWMFFAAPEGFASSLPGLSAEHEDTRTFPEAQRAAHAVRQQALWRERCALLAAALALGVLSQALRRGTRGPSWQAVLGVAALGVFGFTAWSSVTEQMRLQREGRWALTEDSLSLYAGPLASVLSECRARIGPNDAVLLAGRQDLLLNVVATALHGRPIYPLMQAVPVQSTGDALRVLSEQVSLGSAAPRRWLIDLDVLAADDREAFAHPLLLELGP